jgi:hypothetical protein
MVLGTKTQTGFTWQVMPPGYTPPVGPPIPTPVKR